VYSYSNEQGAKAKFTIPIGDDKRSRNQKNDKQGADKTRLMQL